MFYKTTQSNWTESSCDYWFSSVIVDPYAYLALDNDWTI